MCYPFCRRSFPLLSHHHAFPPAHHHHQPKRRYILEILIRAALLQGRNVLVQGSLRDSAWHADYFQQLRALYPGLRIAIVHVRPKNARKRQHLIYVYMYANKHAHPPTQLSPVGDGGEGDGARARAAAGGDDPPGGAGRGAAGLPGAGRLVGRKWMDGWMCQWTGCVPAGVSTMYTRTCLCAPPSSALLSTDTPQSTHTDPARRRGAGPFSRLLRDDRQRRAGAAARDADADAPAAAAARGQQQELDGLLGGVARLSPADQGWSGQWGPACPVKMTFVERRLIVYCRLYVYVLLMRGVDRCLGAVCALQAKGEGNAAHTQRKEDDQALNPNTGGEFIFHVRVR